MALAIVKDDETSGVFTYWLYSNGTVADTWNESLETAFEGSRPESDALTWAEF